MCSKINKYLHTSLVKRASVEDFETFVPYSPDAKDPTRTVTIDQQRQVVPKTGPYQTDEEQRNRFRELHDREVSGYMSHMLGGWAARQGIQYGSEGLGRLINWWTGDKSKGDWWIEHDPRKRTLKQWLAQCVPGTAAGLALGIGGYYLGKNTPNIARALSFGRYDKYIDKGFDRAFQGTTDAYNNLYRKDPVAAAEYRKSEINNRLKYLEDYIRNKYNAAKLPVSMAAGLGGGALGSNLLYRAGVTNPLVHMGASLLTVSLPMYVADRALSKFRYTDIDPMPNRYYRPLPYSGAEGDKGSNPLYRFWNNYIIDAMPGGYITHPTYKQVPNKPVGPDGRISHNTYLSRGQATIADALSAPALNNDVNRREHKIKSDIDGTFTYLGQALGGLRDKGIDLLRGVGHKLHII